MKTPMEIIIRTHSEITRLADGKNWQTRHMKCWAGSPGFSNPNASALRDIIEAWARMAEAHWDSFERKIGDDGVLGPAWKQIGHSLVVMLNGDLGGLDGGTLDKLLRDIASAAAVDLDE